MKIFKIGAIFTVVIALTAVIALPYIQHFNRDFKADNAQYIENFVRDFSTTWEITSIKDQLSNQLLSQIAEPEGQIALAQYRTLGALEDIRDLELTGYESNAQEEVGVFQFKARFHNADTIITFTLIKSEIGNRVDGMKIKTIEKNTKQSEEPFVT